MQDAADTMPTPACVRTPAALNGFCRSPPGAGSPSEGAAVLSAHTDPLSPIACKFTDILPGSAPPPPGPCFLSSLSLTWYRKF